MAKQASIRTVREERRARQNRQQYRGNIILKLFLF